MAFCDTQPQLSRQRAGGVGAAGAAAAAAALGAVWLAPQPLRYVFLGLCPGVQFSLRQPKVRAPCSLGLGSGLRSTQSLNMQSLELSRASERTKKNFRHDNGI